MAERSKDFKPLAVQMGAVDVHSAPESVIGRAGLVEKFWQKLRSGSIQTLAERRIGKTWLLKLAIAKKPDWAEPLFFNGEDSNSAHQFVWRLNKELKKADLIPNKWWNRTETWARRFFQEMQGRKFKAIEIPEMDSWESVLEDTCRHFVKFCEPRYAILVLDELPIFLDKTLNAQGAQEAIQVLDKLRSLRQALPALRMVFCGSLGLHIVLKKLREEGYSGQPVNDMPPFEVPPLEFDDAYYLAGSLLLGEGVACSDVKEVARALAGASSCVPFYIQHMVGWMSSHAEEEWTPGRAVEVPFEMFGAAGDPGEFSYYDRRLGQYYPEEVVDEARAALDVLSREEDGIPFDDLLNLVRHRPKTMTLESEALREVLQMLYNDHYVIQEEGQWRFKLEIIRKWWFEARGRLAL